MATGEGKSIVIAMMAIYTVKHLGKRVHVLENNEGLLLRDFKTYEPFYAQFGLSCSQSIDASSDICYCLKRENNAFFNEHMLAGDLDMRAAGVTPTCRPAASRALMPLATNSFATTRSTTKTAECCCR